MGEKMDLIYVKRRYRNISLTIATIFIAILVIIIFILSNKHIKRKKADELYEKLDMQAKVVQEEERIKKEEAEKLAKLPNLTEIGKNNIANIYTADTKKAFLTFDDGPSKTVTIPILDLLKQENIKATFFVLGSRVELNPDIVKREYEEGHYIANHGYSHIYSQIYSSPQAVIDEFNKTNDAVKNAIGSTEYNSHLFRFPGGFVGGKYSEIKKAASGILDQNNITYVDWNCLTGDAEKQSATVEELMQKLQETSQNKHNLVILMHDAGNKTTTYEALPNVIKFLREQGFEFDNFYSIIK